MNQKTQKNLTHWLSVIVIGIALGFALQFVRAWTEPTQAPPGGNVGAPINTGDNIQTKLGGLGVNTFVTLANTFLGISGGNVGVGTTNPQAKLDVNGGIKVGSDTVCNANKKGTWAYNSNKMKYCDGVNWVALAVLSSQIGSCTIITCTPASGIGTDTSCTDTGSAECVGNSTCRCPDGYSPIFDPLRYIQQIDVGCVNGGGSRRTNVYECTLD